jgi:23S rRNA (cytidine1920-2'-O)/16S rRNA (cytidine1409-2'-O)-methyltransferase
MTGARGRRGGKRRVDEILVERGLAEDLTRARALVLAGRVVVADQRAASAGQLIRPTDQVRVKEGRGPWVGRGAEKLKGAVIDFDLEGFFTDRVILDVGASTGGFTQFAIDQGARQVIALDVGTNQLDWRLRQDPRVIVREKTDIRDLRMDGLPAVERVVCDVSFVSLAKLVPSLIAAGGPTACYLVLVKPQFELSRELIPDGGVVVDDGLRARALQMVMQAFESCGGPWTMRSADARVEGRTGNREIFLFVEPQK